MSQQVERNFSFKCLDPPIPRYMLVDSEEDKKVHRPVTPKDVSFCCHFYSDCIAEH